MRAAVLLSGLIFLTACGGIDRFGSSGGSTAGSTGAVSRACLAADRSSASPRLCSCVQRVANAELSNADRSRLVRFFGDPEFAHAIRISDTPANDAFWRPFVTKVACGKTPI